MTVFFRSHLVSDTFLVPFINDLDPWHAIMLRSTCRTFLEALRPQVAAAMFALTRRVLKPFPMTLRAWSGVWNECTEMKDQMGRPIIGAWATSTHLVGQHSEYSFEVASIQDSFTTALSHALETSVEFAGHNVKAVYVLAMDADVKHHLDPLDLHRYDMRCLVLLSNAKIVDCWDVVRGLHQSHSFLHLWVRHASVDCAGIYFHLKVEGAGWLRVHRESNQDDLNSRCMDRFHMPRLSENRRLARDGIAYTKQEFQERYGDPSMWMEAMPENKWRTALAEFLRTHHNPVVIESPEASSRKDFEQPTLASDAEGGEVIMEGIHHSDPPTLIDQQESAQIAEERWASCIDYLQERHESSGANPGQNVVVLTFSRASAELDAVLMQSVPAQSAILSGVDIKPNWAGGAKIFVPNVGPDIDMPWLDHLLPSNVIMYEDDVADLMEALREALAYRIMKRKPYAAGLCYVPKEGSLMAVSSDASKSSGSNLGGFPKATVWSEPGSSSTLVANTDVFQSFPVIEYTVKGTFVHFDIGDRSVSSRAKTV